MGEVGEGNLRSKGWIQLFSKVKTYQTLQITQIAFKAFIFSIAAFSSINPLLPKILKYTNQLHVALVFSF